MSTTITIVEQKYHVVACPECKQTGFKLVGTGEYSTTRILPSSKRKLLCGGEGTDGCGVMMGELKGLIYYGPKELVTAQVSNPNSNGDFTTDIRGIANPQRYTINTEGRVYLPLPIIVTPETAEVAVCRVDGQVCGAALKWDWYPPLDKEPVLRKNEMRAEIRLNGTFENGIFGCIEASGGSDPNRGRSWDERSRTLDAGNIRKT